MTAVVDLDDLYGGESLEKCEAALERYELIVVPSSSDAAFDAAYGFMHRYFGPLGEIERRSVCAGWADRPIQALGGATVHYRMVLARDADGSVAGARDCYAVRWPDGLCVVYMAHVLVAEGHRRTGIAALLRTVPTTLGRQVLAAGGGGELLLAVEQEPIREDDRDSQIRLCAYGRAGFRAVAPEILPYCQPDFRDLEALGLPPLPLPMLAVMRWVGHEHAAAIPARMAAAYVDSLYTVFGSHCRPADLAGPWRHALDALAASGLDPVPLIELPRHPEDAAGLLALRRDHTLQYYRS